MIEETFWAWLAGFADGEGHINLHKSKNLKHKVGYQWLPRVQIANNDLAALEYIQRTLGFGRIHLVTTKPSHHYRLDFATLQVQQIVPHLLPYLLVKKQEAILLLKACRILSNRLRSDNLTENTLLEIEQAIYECRGGKKTCGRKADIAKS